MIVVETPSVTWTTGEVLDVRPRADADRADVAAKHGAEPDARLVAELDVADDRRVRRDEHVAAEPRRWRRRKAERAPRLAAPGSAETSGSERLPAAGATFAGSGAGRAEPRADSVSSPWSECLFARVIATSTISPAQIERLGARDVHDLVALGAARPSAPPSLPAPLDEHPLRACRRASRGARASCASVTSKSRARRSLFSPRARRPRA